MSTERSPRNHLRLALIGTLVAGGSFAAAYGWHHYTAGQAIVQALPARPAAAKRIPELSRRLEEADQRVRKSPRDSSALESLARLYHANGYFREALSCWVALESLEPSEPRWAYYLADAYRATSRYDEMLKALERTTDRDPGYAPAWLQRAEHALKTGDLDGARRYYEQRMSLVPNDPYARLGLARVAHQSGRTEEGTRLVAALVKDTPGFPSAHNWYAELLAKAGRTEEAEGQRLLGRASGRFKEAEDPWLAALRDDCYDPDRLFALGTVEYQTEQGDRGVKRFQRAVELAPDNLNGLEMLADLYSKLGYYTQARDTLLQYHDRAGGAEIPPNVTVALSEALRNTGQPAEALRVAQAALLRMPRQSILHNAAGAAALDLDDVNTAIRAFRQAVALDPDYPEANFNLGAALLAAGEIKEGIPFVEKALLRKPRFAPALGLLGRVAMDEGRLDDAEKYLDMLYRAQPTERQARQAMAALYLAKGGQAERAGRMAEAEAIYRKGRTFASESPDLASALGGVLILQEKFNEALPVLEEFRKLAPTSAQAPFFLAQANMRLGRGPEALALLREAEQLATASGNKEIAEFCRQILAGAGPTLPR